MINLLGIVEKIEAKVINPNNLDLEKINIRNISSLELAQQEDITFFFDSKWASFLENTKALVVCHSHFNEKVSCIQLIHPHPKKAMAEVAAMFEVDDYSFVGISSAAIIDKSVKIGSNSSVYPNAYIEKNVVIGENCIIYPSVYIGDSCVIADNTIIFPNAVIMAKTLLGKNVIIHSCCVIGGEGFGFLPGSDNVKKIPQLGNVIIEDDVEVGSGSTIDRATLHSTIIEKGTKIDSQVHIGHNVKIGKHSILCGQVGISGSVQVGKNLIAAGRSAVAPGLVLGDKITLAANTGVTSNKKGDKVYAGFPAVEVRDWRKQAVGIRNLPNILERLKALEKKLDLN
jgi:UDP-3-O-[3-hydroxymyristoyl] glucosamine N-acyltransferase